MEFGFWLPLSGPQASPESLATLARHGEELGFGLAYTSDRIVRPRTIASHYPYGESGDYRGGGSYMEQLTLLTFVAGHTSRIRLVPLVMVLPYRNPVHTAKVLATIDVLSQGRLTVGCGVGWMKEEFEALGAPPYESRGEVSDEYILAFKELWTKEHPTFHGKYCSFSDVVFEPKPIQKPHPPIWIGGESPRAMRRAARLGDGWCPAGVSRDFPLKTAAQLSRSIDRLRRYAEDAGRDPDEIEVAYNGVHYEDRQEQMLDGARCMFTGTLAQMAEDIQELEDMGVRYVMFELAGSDLDTSLARMERFASHVMPLARH